ncbi:TPA: hypothetical protein U2I64_001633 [Providencia stuartii]|uniref:hypothetical protein n=1 Tax=Providencia TaxID=586 RepID=UPI002AB48A96|nr:hypothetical protein [Providencia stuartii]HEM7172938.1 hypothetical protein [Providencia stuartii]
MVKLNPRIQHDLTMHFAEIYHKGSTYIPTFKLLQWFGKDGGKITKAFFTREIFSRWYEYLELEDEARQKEFRLSVLQIMTDYTVTKPEGFTIFREGFLYIDSSNNDTQDQEDDDSE